MSKAGLEQSEKIASSLDRDIKSSLVKQRREIKAEIDKLEFLLGDKQQIQAWRNSPADSARLQHILSGMDEAERLYLTAGDEHAAQIFKQRMKRQLEQELTNLKANELEVKVQMAKFKAQTKGTMLQKLNEVKREGTLSEMYQESRSAGGFLSNFGKAYLQDLVTLETKAAGSKTLGEYMENLYNTYEKGLKDVFVKGIIRGDSYKQMVDNLQKQTNITAGKANLLVTTEANAIFNQSVRDVIDDNPLVKGYRFRAVLDSRTSKICQEHDGEYIPKEDVQPGINYPPLHPRCRSTVTTVLYDEDERRDMQQRYTKNGSNQWEKVPPGMNYQEYKEKFGFANSKNPRQYNASTRDIHDATPARITPTQYKGYVKPSASATSRIEKMLDAYEKGDQEFLASVRENTKQTDTAKAIFRQAQAESGFDGKPMQLDAKSFDKEVEKNGYRKVYRQFTKEEYLNEFLEGEQPFGSGQANYGPGTYTFSQPPKDDAFGPLTKEMALKSSDSKILQFSSTLDSQGDIYQALTPDSRINVKLQAFPPAKRREMLSTLAIEYGYDAIEVQNASRGNYTLVLNRTAVIVKGD